MSASKNNLKPCIMYLWNRKEQKNLSELSNSKQTLWGRPKKTGESNSPVRKKMLFIKTEYRSVIGRWSLAGLKWFR